MSVVTSSIANGAVAANGAAAANGVAVASRTVSEAVGQLERDRLRMMMLIRRFEERTYQEYTKPARRSAGSAISTAGRKPSPSAPPRSSTKLAIT